MKLQIVHFTRQVPVCGSFSPKSLNMKSSGDRAYITGMELDWEKRCVWLEAGGNRTPPELRGKRLPIPMEHVILSVPADAEPVAPVVAPVPEKKSGARA